VNIQTTGYGAKFRHTNLNLENFEDYTLRKPGNATKIWHALLVFLLISTFAMAILI
jgi:hypothetical protein